MLGFSIPSAILVVLAVNMKRVSSLAPSPSNPPSAASRLRALCLADGRSSRAVAGVHDALSARIFAEAGSEVLFLSGFGVSASRLAAPDAGILTLSEMEDAARSVVSASRGVPVIVDGDTGFGGSGNVRRTIRNLAAAGAAAVSIEDQVFPKRCTYAAGTGVRVVPRDAALRRIRTAVAARDEASSIDGREVLLVARTDCRAALGLEEAIARCRLFEEAGADIVYAENLQSVDEYRTLRKSLDPGTIMMMAQVQQDPAGADNDGESRVVLTVDEVGELGYSLALFGITALQATVGAVQSIAAEFLSSSTGGIVSKDFAQKIKMSDFKNVKDIVGFDELDQFEAQYPCE